MEAPQRRDCEVYLSHGQNARDVIWVGDVRYFSIFLVGRRQVGMLFEIGAIGDTPQSRDLCRGGLNE